jgi:ADP-glucose pyrophosphorylase
LKATLSRRDRFNSQHWNWATSCRLIGTHIRSAGLEVGEMGKQQFTEKEIRQVVKQIRQLDEEHPLVGDGEWCWWMDAADMLEEFAALLRRQKKGEGER